MLPSLGPERGRHDLATEQQQVELSSVKARNCVSCVLLNS